VKVTLKKPWLSPRGKLYPSGSIFIKSELQSHPSLGLIWYNFSIPNESYGIVLIPNSVFSIISEYEKALRAARKKSIDKHNEATKDPFMR